MPGTFEVVILHHEAGIDQRCSKCRKRYEQGNQFMVQVNIEDRGSHSYLLGTAPPVVCCGEKKKTIRTFPTEETARVAADETITYLNEHLTTAGLPLLDYVQPNAN